ncbi:MAG: RasGEF domain-containing protein, partial [archaeon]|nr:RasGEF domain-containing protein [archaeon]
SQAPLARFLVRLLKSLHQLHNFSCLTFLLMILHGFFERTTLSTAHRQRIAELESITTSKRKYAELRIALRASTLPALPYVGMYLVDLHFILEPSFDGPPLTTQHGGGVKFYKMRSIAKIIQDIQIFINVPYNLQEVPEIQHFLESKLQAMHI